MQLLGALRAAGEPTRLRILGLCSHAELSVSDLTQILGQSQPRVSRHLKLLCEAGLLVRSREGVWALFHAADESSGTTGAELGRILLDLMPDDDPQLLRDLERLEQVKKDRTAAAESYFRANAAAWDRIRSLYIDECEVERRLLAMTPGRIQHHVDLGTGTGRILEVFGGRSQRGLGIDSSREMLAVARTRLDRSVHTKHLAVRHSDIYNVPLPSHCADLVTLHQVLHYLSDPAAAIREAARILQPGGQLVTVDFAQHDVEFLREDHAHRYLGFANEKIFNWYQQAGLAPGRPELLSGEPLTVMIWAATAPSGGREGK